MVKSVIIYAIYFILKISQKKKKKYQGILLYKVTKQKKNKKTIAALNN